MSFPQHQKSFRFLEPQKPSVFEVVKVQLENTEIRNFCPTENKRFSVPFKTRSFKGYKTGSFESYQRP